MCVPRTATARMLLASWRRSGITTPTTSSAPRFRCLGSDGLVVRADELADQREDLALPALPAEDAVMAGAGLQVVALHIGSEAGQEIMRRHRLTDRADVVALAFDREQSGA